MNRRSFLYSALGAAAALEAGKTAASAPLHTKITRVRAYLPPKPNPTFNQSNVVVTIETDGGITGVGEGGTKDTIEQCAGMLIGQDPGRIEALWQLLFRGYFYPAGREKLHALGALDLALWDIKGKALGVPVYSLLGGLSRNYVPCYSTAFPSKGSAKETARACVEMGFFGFRTSALEAPRGAPFDAQQSVRRTHQHCIEVRDGVGPDGHWMIDYHTRYDIPDAVRLSTLIEPLEPYFCEDLVRSENPEVYKTLRPMVKVPIAAGEQFGAKWDVNGLVERQLIDFSRVTLPNSGGITEFMKIAALCDTHYVGLVPHFTGPIAEAALAHTCGVFPGPVVMEMLGAGNAPQPHLPECYDFRNGKIWPNERPGLGVTFDPKQAKLIAEVTERYQPIPTLRRPDGSLTNW